MHRQIRDPVEQGALQFLDEQALAADCGEGFVQNLVALGGKAANLNLDPIERLERRVAHEARLPHRQRAFPAGDHKLLQTAFVHTLPRKAWEGQAPTSLKPNEVF